MHLSDLSGRAERPNLLLRASSAPDSDHDPLFRSIVGSPTAHTPVEEIKSNPGTYPCPIRRMITYSSGRNRLDESWKSSEFITTKIAFTSRSAAHPQEKGLRAAPAMRRKARNCS